MLYLITDFLILMLFLLIGGSLLTALLLGRRMLPGNGGTDSLKDSQALSRRTARLHGLSTSQEEEYHDSVTLAVCFSRFALQVAYADGVVTQAEYSVILNFFRKANPALLEQLASILRRDMADPGSIDWDYNLQEARRVLAKPRWQSFSAILFDGLLRISLADGHASQRELGIIFGIMQELGWSPEQTASWFRSQRQDQGGRQEWRASQTSMAPDARRQALDILGLPADADATAIKKRYRQLVQEHHPDRYATMGEEIQRSATTRFQAIQQAWETLKASS